jgi:hypothetical protein
MFAMIRPLGSVWIPHSHRTAKGAESCGRVCRLGSKLVANPNAAPTGDPLPDYVDPMIATLGAR